MELKKLYLVLLILSALMAPVAKSQVPEKFSKGIEYYTAGNYKEALQAWMDMYYTGYRSAALNYNIGNTYFKLSDIPNAILFYERAYLLKPADENIRYNLEVARTMTVDRFQEIPELFIVKWYNFMALILSANTWAIISVACFILFLGLLSVYIYSSKYSLKVWGFWLSMLMLVVSASSIILSLRNKTLVYDSGKAIIMSHIVEGKSSPDASGTNLFILHEGTKVTIGDEVGEWYEIRLSDGNKGWVPSNSVMII